MTITVAIKVNGRYKAIVKQDGLDPVEIHGNYEGSPNAGGLGSFSMRHKMSNKLVISEEEVPYPEPETPETEIET